MGRGDWDGEDEGTTACACGRHCAERDYEGNPALGPRSFCDTDEHRIGDAIAGLPETYASLRLLLPFAGQREERVTGSRDAPVPVNLDVQAFMRQIVQVTCSWEDQVRAAVRLADLPDGRRRDGVALAQASRTLSRHLTALLSMPVETKVRFVPPGKLDETGHWWTDTAGDAWTYTDLDGTGAGLEFLQMHGRARGMLGLTRQRRRITEVPCDGCRGKTLVQSEAKAGGWEPVVRCTACSVVYLGAHYDLLMGRVYQAQLAELERHRKAS